MGEVYADRLRELLADEREAAEDFWREVRKARRWYAARQALIDRQRSALYRMRNEPEVVVRRGWWKGSTKVFHWKESECGWLPPRSQEIVLLSEAERKGCGCVGRVMS